MTNQIRYLEPGEMPRAVRLACYRCCGRDRSQSLPGRLPVLRGGGVDLGIFTLHLAERRARGGELCSWRDPARFSGPLKRGASKACGT